MGDEGGGFGMIADHIKDLAAFSVFQQIRNIGMLIDGCYNTAGILKKIAFDLLHFVLIIVKGRGKLFVLHIVNNGSVEIVV